MKSIKSLLGLDVVRCGDSVCLSRSYFDVGDYTRSATAAKYNIDNRMPLKYLPNAQALFENVIDKINEHFNKYISIHSGYRCDVLNKKVGGSAKSQHKTGEAIDITVNGVFDEVLFIFIMHDCEFDQLILEKTWVHVSFSRIKNRKQVFDNRNGKMRKLSNT